MTEAGRLTPQQTAMLRSKQCNSINRVAYVCCEGNIQKANIPRPPTCGTLFGDRVSFVYINLYKASQNLLIQKLK